MTDPLVLPPGQQIAARMRELRQTLGWSLDRTAQETGVSKAMLGQIERGESSPTVATLWKIATGFKVSFSSFLDGPMPDATTTLFRSAKRLRRQPGEAGMLVAPLFPFDPTLGFELFELTLLPGYERESEPHERGVSEHVVVLEGEMEVLIEGQWHRLLRGEAVRFAADLPHGYRNLGEAAARFHNLIRYP
ncbi:helix-turn-helix domain-containing protein [Aeromonas simiae]|nr:helix-turn-helix domain-containing protein [Aeromonas simiae]